MNPKTVVLYPGPGIGHAISMVELGKLILHHHGPNISITILLTTGFMDSPSVDSYIASISESHPSISFLRFPHLGADPEILQRHSFAAVIFDFVNRSAPNFRHCLLEIGAARGRVKAVVIDMFCAAALRVARELEVPVYYFFSSGASALAYCLYLPTILEKSDGSFKDQEDLMVDFPAGLPCVKATEMPDPTLDRVDPAFSDFHEICVHLAKADGILVNTFDELEPIGLRALTTGSCVVGAPTPPTYCIGPLVSVPKSRGTDNADLAWLEQQPNNSVVFLCFGSMGTFSASQVKEIAIGLERSRHRFLWVVKKPISEEASIRTTKTTDPSLSFDLEGILPDGFLERTNERGRIVKSWAPQVEVLNKESVGGFVTHCGWNSTLEAVVAGVPMIAWPLYAEQHLNRNILVENMRMAIGVKEGSDGIVSGEEVERVVRELMEGEVGKEIRERSLRMKDKAKEALEEGGSSLSNLAKFWTS